MPNSSVRVCETGPAYVREHVVDGCRLKPRVWHGLSWNDRHAPTLRAQRDRQALALRARLARLRRSWAPLSRVGPRLRMRFRHRRSSGPPLVLLVRGSIAITANSESLLQSPGCRGYSSRPCVVVGPSLAAKGMTGPLPARPEIDRPRSIGRYGSDQDRVGCRGTE